MLARAQPHVPQAETITACGVWSGLSIEAWGADRRIGFSGRARRRLTEPSADRSLRVEGSVPPVEASQQLFVQGDVVAQKARRLLALRLSRQVLGRHGARIDAARERVRVRRGVGCGEGGPAERFGEEAHRLGQPLEEAEHGVPAVTRPLHAHKNVTIT